MHKFLNIDQAEAGDEGAGGGSQEGAEGAAGAAGAGTDGGTVDQGAAGGETSSKPAWEQDEIVWNGEKKKFSRQEIINFAQQAYNVTQKEQSLAKLTKDAQERLARIDALMAEAEGAGKEGEGEGEGEADEPIGKLSKEVEALRLKEQIREWDAAVAPIIAKNPEISEKKLLAEFRDRVASKEVDDTAEGLAKTAELMVSEREGTVSKRLEALLKDEKNPQLQSIREKAVKDYLDGKLKLRDAGGEGGGSPAGAKTDKPGSIDDVARKVRESIGEG